MHISLTDCGWEFVREGCKTRGGYRFGPVQLAVLNWNPQRDHSLELMSDGRGSLGGDHEDGGRAVI